MELVGKVAQVTSLPHKSTLGAFISLLRPSTEVDAKLYYYQLTSSDVQSEIRRYASTTTNISNISSSRLAEIPLSVPPLPEQHRIVAEIEKQFTRLGASVTALKRVQANLKRYRASVLRAACEGKLVPTEAELARLEGRGYEPAAQLLERILCERRAHVVHFTSAFYILTSNKGFGEWGEFLGDSVIASAVFDRLLHHSHVLNIRGRATGCGRTAGRSVPLPAAPSFKARHSPHSTDH